MLPHDRAALCARLLTGEEVRVAREGNAARQVLEAEEPLVHRAVVAITR